MHGGGNASGQVQDGDSGGSVPERWASMEPDIGERLNGALGALPYSEHALGAHGQFAVLLTKCCHDSSEAFLAHMSVNLTALAIVEAKSLICLFPASLRQVELSTSWH